MITSMDTDHLSTLRDWLRSVSVRDASSGPTIPLTLDQVLTVIERELGSFSSLGFRPLTKDMVHNYIKAGLVSPSVGRRYNSDHVFLLYLISLIKTVLPIASIVDAVGAVENVSALSQRFARSAEEEFRRIAYELSAVDKAIREDPQRAAELALRFATMATAYQGTARALIADIKTGKKNDREKM